MISIYVPSHKQKLIFGSLSMICMQAFGFNLFIKINEKNHSYKEK